LKNDGQTRLSPEEGGSGKKEIAMERSLEEKEDSAYGPAHFFGSRKESSSHAIGIPRGGKRGKGKKNFHQRRNGSLSKRRAYRVKGREKDRSPSEGKNAYTTS